MSLTKQDVKDLSFAKVLAMQSERLNDVHGIQDRSPDKKILNAPGEDAGKAVVIMEDLRLLGIRHDELLALDNADEKVAKLTDYLETPGNAPPYQPGGSKSLRADEWKSADDLIAEDTQYQAAHKGGERRFQVEVPLNSLLGPRAIVDSESKVLGTDNTLAGVDDEFPPQSIRIPGVRVPVLFQQNNISQMFLQGTTNQNAVLYMQETVTSEGAVEVLEGGAKAEADISFAEVSSPVENIAVTLPVTSQLLEDVSFMRSWVGGRLRLFVLNREDLQLISGDGVAPNIEGVLTVAGTGAQSYSIAAVAADNTLPLDAVYNAITDVREAFLSPSGVAMAAATWASRFRLAKDANSNYLLGGAAGEAADRIWGLPVTLNERMPAEVAAAEPIFVAAREAAMVTRRNTLTLAVTDSHASEFTSNVLRFRAEMRTSFPIFRPAGISVVTSAV